jgi:hypothetical protein
MRLDNQNNQGDILQGDVRLYIKSVKDFTYLEEFCQYLKSTGEVDIIFYSWTEQTGMVIFIYLREPIPLVEKLLQMKMVTAVDRKNNEIYIELSGSYVEIIASIQKTLKQGILVI